MKTKFFLLFATFMIVVVIAVGQPNRNERRSSTQRVESVRSNQNSQRVRETHDYDRREAVRQNPGEMKRASQSSQRIEAVRRTPTQSSQRNESVRQSQQSRVEISKTNNRNSTDYGNRERVNQSTSSRERIIRDNQRDNVYRNDNQRDINRWDKDRNDYNRKNWENRNYDWDRHNWSYSKYYRKNHIPYYFRNNTNYWYYPSYGHILRNFNHRPIIFYSNRHPYYFYDGFIYKYYNNIGYVWLEDPYDIWFEELPYNARRVIIGGQVFFKLVNTYFEVGPLGFRLIILPDRYYI